MKPEVDMPEVDLKAEFAAFRVAFEKALVAQGEGNAEPFIALWSPKPDVMIFGALGGMERGWSEIGDRLRWVTGRVSARITRLENLTTAINGTLALTADLEHTIRTLDGRSSERTLRVTQGYRFEDGAWKIFYRHGDVYRPSGR
jgi:ketosteroid isomerase-like protein